MNTFSEDTLWGIAQNDSTMNDFTIADAEEEGEFNSTKGTDFARLGVAIGKNKHLEELTLFLGDNDTALDASNRDFYEGLKQNTSITKLLLRSFRGIGREIFNAFQENNNLVDLGVSFCNLGNGGCRFLTKALRKCTNLKYIELYHCNITDEQLGRITESVSEHRLEKLKFGNNRIGATGCEVIARLLRDPTCNLDTLVLSNNLIDDVGATTIISSLANNTKLQCIYLEGNQIDRSIQNAFLGLICNTSSINSTHLSNHTLEIISLRETEWGGDLYDNTPDLPLLLQLNMFSNKSHVAIRKILQYHPNIDMSPLYNLDLEEDDKNLKALPYVIDWFERAREALSGSDVRQCCANRSIESIKLSSIYQFANAMPLLFDRPTSNLKQRRKRKRKRVYGKVQLLVRGFGSGTHAVDISLLDNVESLQAKLESKTGINPVGHVMLVCNGKRIEKGDTLNDSGCTNGSTVQASFFGRGGHLSSMRR